MTKDRMSLQVSADEMRYYRDNEHLTNKEIAERLGISYNTVIRYIGKQPTDFKHKARLKRVDNMPLVSVSSEPEKSNPTEGEFSAVPQTQNEPCLLVEAMQCKLYGDSCSYVVHFDTQTIDMFVNGSDTKISFALHKIQKIIRELSAIDAKQATIKDYKGAW